jgi:hypothetical protein
MGDVVVNMVTKEQLRSVRIICLTIAAVCFLIATVILFVK